MRTRSRSQPLDSIYGVSGYAQPLYNGYVSETTLSPYRLGQEVVETISDDNRYPLSRACKVVSHQKSKASVVDHVFHFYREDRFGWGLPGHGACTAHVRLAVLPNTNILPTTYDVDWGTLVSRLADRVRNKVQTKSQLFVTAAELVKTYQMVTNPFGLLKKGWRIAAGKKTASDLAKLGSNLWLEGRYGWNSMFVDVKNFSSSINKYIRTFGPSDDVGKIGERLRFTQVIQQSVQNPLWLRTGGSNPYSWLAGLNTDVLPWSNYYLGGGILLDIELEAAVTQASVFCTRIVPARKQHDAVTRLLEYMGATSDNIAEFIWEVIPYSFVVDWFVDCNGIASIPDRIFLESEQLNRLGYSVKSTRRFRVKVGLPSNDQDDYFVWKSNSPFKIGEYGEVSSYERFSGLPPMNLNPFTLKGLSMTHLIDSGGLILQKMLR